MLHATWRLLVGKRVLVMIESDPRWNLVEAPKPARKRRAAARA